MFVRILKPGVRESNLRISAWDTLRSPITPGCATIAAWSSITRSSALSDTLSGKTSCNGALPNHDFGHGLSVSLISGNIPCQYGLGPSYKICPVHQTIMRLNG